MMIKVFHIERDQKAGWMVKDFKVAEKARAIEKTFLEGRVSFSGIISLPTTKDLSILEHVRISIVVQSTSYDRALFLDQWSASKCH